MPNENASDQAKARLAALEADPKHNQPHGAVTRTDRLDDPAHQKPDAKVDPGWHQDKDGHWTHPEFES